MNAISKYAGVIKLILLLVAVPLIAISYSVRKGASLRRVVSEQAFRIENAGKTETVKIEPPQSGGRLKNGEILNILDMGEVKVEGYTPYLLSKVGIAELYAGEMILCGGFVPLTIALEKMEQRKDRERIVSVEYRVIRSSQKRESNLQMRVIFQEISNEK